MKARILAKNVLAVNDTRRTGLNNNTLIVGPSGAGKTRGYVKPNILQCNDSMIIADTKGDLVEELGPVLKRRGYRVLDMNFKDLRRSCGYNPLDYIRFDEDRGCYVEQDILTVSAALVPAENQKEPFWENAGRLYLNCVLAYVMECLPPEEHTLKYAIDLLCEVSGGAFRVLLNELEVVNPSSFAVQSYRLFKDNYRTEKTEASIVAVLSERLNGLNFAPVNRMYTSPDRVDLRAIGKEKTALFLSISDMDRSMDRLVGLLYTQALQQLVHVADTEYANHRLPVPVHFILDDFANFHVPDFHHVISVIRSRDIYCSLIMQSLSQLYAQYGEMNAKTIINNCDQFLYLGGMDLETAQYISVKLDKSMSTVLNMPLNEAYLFTRGQKPRIVEKYNLKDHPLYSELPEAQREKQGTEFYV